MEETGRRLVRELKAHILWTMEQVGECRPEEQGVSYRVIQELAGLGLELPAQDGWFTWSLLASLVQDRQVDVIREGLAFAGGWLVVKRDSSKIAAKANGPLDTILIRRCVHQL